MITERGPHGTIAVMTIESEKETVPHALSVLRSRNLKHSLPMYVRDLFGATQLCADCTGLVLIDSPEAIQFDPLGTLKQKAIADFLSSLIDYLDHCLNLSGINLLPKNVWMDPISGTLFFTYLPIRSSFLGSCSLSSLDCNALDKLLMHPFFNPVLPENMRHKIVDAVEKGDERSFLKAISEIETLHLTAQTSNRKCSSLAKQLLLILLLMVLSLIFFLTMQERLHVFSHKGAWHLPYLILFSGGTLFTIFRHQAYKKSGTEKKKNESPFTFGKELFFPKVESNTTELYAEASLPLEPAFLTGECVHPKESKNKLRGVIWTNDFLIGSDQILCDFPIDHASVSSKHARIVHRQGIFYLVDLGSRLGSYIGHRKVYTFEENPLSDGDYIRIGAVRFRFSCAQSASVSSARAKKSE